MSALRAARPGMIITMPLGWVNANFPDVSGVYAQLAPDLDQLNLMSYGMADGWECVVEAGCKIGRASCRERV